MKTATHSSSSAATEIKLIHIARQSLGLDEDTYRALVARFGNGATSSTQLSVSQRKALLTHMKDSGFVLRPKAGKVGSAWQREPQMRKLRAMWYVLAEAGHVEQPADADACNAAIEAWAKRQLSTHTPPLDALRFASGAQMNKLIEELKAWGLRVGAEIV